MRSLEEIAVTEKTILWKSRADEVTFFEDRARVHRIASGSCVKGAQTIGVEGVSVLIDDPGLVVRVTKGVGSIQAAQVRRVIQSEASESFDIQEAEARNRKAQGARQFASSVVEQVKLDRTKLGELEASLMEQMNSVPDGEAAHASAWGEALANLDAQWASLQTDLQEARRALLEAEREERRSQILLNELRTEKPQVNAQVEVQIDVDEDGEFELLLEYVVPCALWRPSHRAWLKTDASPTLEVVTMATVWQATGELWADVKCVFSTARLSKPASAPLLEDDVLFTRRKSDEERKVIQVDVREQHIVTTGTDGGRLVEEMPGIDDGGRPLTFTSERRVTIPSDGEPFRVEVGTLQLPCKTETVAYPELDGAVHVRAIATWNGAYPLLAGPVALMREREFAGISRTDFVGVGEAFSLGLGPQSGIRIHRRVDEKRGQTKLTNAHWIERAIHVYVSNLSSEERNFEIVERVPVSEIDEVQVTMKDSKYGCDRDGFVRISVNLGPRKTLEKIINYRIEHPSKVVIN